MICAVVLAGGNSTRFGSNKLLSLVNGRPMFTYILRSLESAGVSNILVVTQYAEILSYCIDEGIRCILSENCRKGASFTIKEAVQNLESPAILFTAADQPYIKPETLRSFIAEFEKSGKGLASCSCSGRPSNPAIFKSKYFGELLALEGDRGGRSVINNHLEDCFFFEAPAEELRDIDFRL